MTISPISWLVISQFRDSSAAFSISSANSSICAAETGRLYAERSTRLISLSLSKASRLLSFLTTIKGSVSIFSYVVKRLLHSSHCRLRRMAASPADRESITFSSSEPQYGHLIRNPPFVFYRVSIPENISEIKWYTQRSLPRSVQSPLRHGHNNPRESVWRIPVSVQHRPLRP